MDQVNLPCGRWGITVSAEDTEVARRLRPDQGILSCSGVLAFPVWDATIFHQKYLKNSTYRLGGTRYLSRIHFENQGMGYRISHVHMYLIYAKLHVQHFAVGLHLFLQKK